MNNGARIVMTSRDYIYNRARQDLKETAFPLLKESQVVIDVHRLRDGNGLTCSKLMGTNALSPLSGPENCS